MQCSGTACCECSLKELDKLCSLAMKNRECDIDILVERLKREIAEYDDRKRYKECK